MSDNQLNVYFLDEISLKLDELCFRIQKYLFFLVDRSEALELEDLFTHIIHIQNNKIIEKDIFLRWANIQKNHLAKHIFPFYECVNFNDFIQLLLIFCVCSSDFIIKYIMLCVIDMRDLNHIHIDDVDNLIGCIGRLKNSQLYEEKKLTILTPNSNGYYSFSNVMHFITTDISFFRSLVSLQKRLCECTLGYDRWKAIKRRKVEMVEIWKYRDTHRGESPTEPFCRRLYRELFGGTNPYKHDYEVPMNNINEYMNDILSYFKVRYHPIPYKELKDPRIVALRRIGSTYSSMKFEPYSFGDISGLSSNKDGSESNSSNYYIPATRARVIISSSSSSSYNGNNNGNNNNNVIINNIIFNNNNNNIDNNSNNNNNNVEEISYNNNNNNNKKKSSPQQRSPLSPLGRFEKSDESVNTYYNKKVIKKEQSASTCISKRGKEITIPGTIDEEE